MKFSQWLENKKILPIANVEGARKVGDHPWFEYHCFESHESCDAKLWYHSHQQCTILGMAPNDGADIRSQQERMEAGLPLAYRVRFADGYVDDAMEDELYDDPKDFERPDPPSGPNG